VSFCQDVEHAGEAESALPQQDAGVKPEVGDLAGQRVIAFLCAGKEDLDGFLATFRRIAGRPPSKSRAE